MKKIIQNCILFLILGKTYMAQFGWSLDLNPLPQKDNDAIARAK